ncbi:MAG: hypothetical protein ACLSEY_13580 [Enterocloster sp.]
MSQKHLKKWYIREEAEDFALYGTDDKNKLIKAEAPYMVVNPAGIGIVYSNNGEFTVDIMDMAIRLFDPNGFSCVPVCGLRMYANAADPSYCGDPFRRNSAALPGFSASAIADGDSGAYVVCKRKTRKPDFLRYSGRSERGCRCIKESLRCMQ